MLLPRTRIVLIAVIAFLLAFLETAAWLSEPWMGIELSADSTSVRVDYIAPDGPNAALANPSSHWLAIGTESSWVQLDSVDLLEEPDAIPDRTSFRRFFERQKSLHQILQSNTFFAQTEDGDLLSIRSGTRPWWKLPVSYWSQMLFGMVGMLVGASVWVFHPRSRTSVYFFFTGIGYAISCFAAAYYSSRELAIDGALFRLLSTINHLGTLTFSAAFVLLLHRYPTPLTRKSIAVPVITLFASCWVLEAIELFQSVTLLRYAPILTAFSLGVIFGLLQWRRASGNPVEKAALKWFLISLFMGTSFFALAAAVPIALHIPTLADQSVLLGTFLFMYLGMALGVIRFRLFDLDRWWFNTWLWLLGGLCVILIDWLLVLALNLSHSATLVISLALSGWLYFPVRQRLWRRISRKGFDDQELSLQLWIQSFFSLEETRQVEYVWRQLFQQEFQPLSLQPSTLAVARPTLEESGATLRLPSADFSGSYALYLADNGSRLFNRQDLKKASMICDLGRQALKVIQQRERLLQDERQRIMRDLHDDLGAKLLSLIYIHKGTEGENLARSAMQDMRDVLTAIEAEPCLLSAASESWRDEAQQRAKEANCQLSWQNQGLPPDFQLSARQRTNIARILRELLTNAIKHGDSKDLDIGIKGTDNHLMIVIRQSPEATPPSSWIPGRGILTTERRLKELAGSLRWDEEEDGIACTVCIPFKADSQIMK